MESALGLVIVALIMSVVATIQSTLNNNAATKRQQADWARADVVADRARHDRDRAASVLVESNRRVADEARKTSTALLNSTVNIKADIQAVHEIAETTQTLAVTTHALVNSALTAVKQAELDGLIRERDLMRRLPGISREDMEMIDAKISDRQQELGERSKEAALIAARQENHKE